MSVPDLELQGLVVRFGGVTALDDVSLAVAPGSIHAVIGPNGAGKSTVFNAVSNLVPLETGEVRVAGRRIDGRRSHDSAHAGVGRTFQNLGLFAEMTVEENLLLGMYLRGSSGWIGAGLRLPSERRERESHRYEVRRVAGVVGIEHLLGGAQSSLSYGDRKRVELARALCMRPTVLLLDEPVAGMNPQETTVMTDTIRTINRETGTTIVLVEHDMRMVMSLAWTVTVLNFGRVIATGTPEEVQRDPQVIAAYLGGAAPSAPDASVPGGSS